MTVGVIELMVMALGASLLLVPLLTLAAIAIQPSDEWRASGHNRIVWILLVLLLPVVGSIAYFIAVHRDVSTANRSLVGTAR